MEYQDFTIGIRSAGEQLCMATVIEAPLPGTPTIYFARPLDKPELEALLAASENPPGTPGASEPDLEENGKRLHSSLFQGELADLFERCQSFARDRQAGLRLRLMFGMDDPFIEYLAALPWEWLWDPGRAAFLATERKNPVVRDFAACHIQPALEVEGPLRILVVDAAPRDLHALKLRREIERMVEALEPLQQDGWVKLLRLLEPTPEALRHALLNSRIHVLHFMGHAGYHEETGYGALTFVKPDRTSQVVHGERFSNLLKDLPDLRLVVLNACQTARHAGRRGTPLYSGVASAVLDRAGIPAVVANQYSITDTAAVAFSREFYQRIAAGDDVDAAITEVRLLLEGQGREWGTPVLFLNTSHGKLFATAPPKPRGVVEELDLSRLAAEPVRLGVRSFIGYGDMEKRDDDVLDFTPLFNGRFIGQPESWQTEVYPRLREFLGKEDYRRRPVLLDFASHVSIAFAAGWILEAKSGVDVRVRQRTKDHGENEWYAADGSAPEVPLWSERRDIRLSKKASDVALALSVSVPGVVEHVEAFIRSRKLPVGRIIDAAIPDPGPHAVLGGAHALRLAETLLPRLLLRHPHERGGKLHLFCSAPNALVFYLGQIARSLGRIVLYEFAFETEGSFGRYQASIELPAPDERRVLPDNW